MLALLGGLDEDTLRQLGGGQEMPENWHDVLALLSRVEAMRHHRGADLARGLRASLAEVAPHELDRRLAR